MKLSSKLPNIGDSIFSVMSTLAQKHNAINLSQGFPDFKSDPKFFDLVTKSMYNGYNQYAPMAGSLALRQAISKKIETLYHTTYNPETEITVTAGATQAIFTIISAFIQKDDEAIIFCPAYDCYQPSVTLNGGKVIAIDLNAPTYNIDWNVVKQHFSSKTKMIIINTPHNPTGNLWSKHDMLQLQELTQNSNCIVLSDEVYEHIIFDDEKHYSACMFSDLKSRSFIVASFGKTFHNTGWKTGYCCAPKPLMDEFKKTHQFNVFSVHHPTQIALAQYLEDPNNYLSLSNFYKQKRDLFLNLLSNSKFTFTPSKGTYFQTLNYSKITAENDVDFSKRLTIDYGVASIPLSVFSNRSKDAKMLRFCFAKTDETLKAACKILCNV